MPFLIYSKQKTDTKRDASKTILAEIVNSEKVIQDVKNIKKYSRFINLEPDPMKFYLGNFSWNQYKYLFIGDFDAYEWEKINLYFLQSTAFNETIKNIAMLGKAAQTTDTFRKLMGRDPIRFSQFVRDNLKLLS